MVAGPPKVMLRFLLLISLVSRSIVIFKRFLPSSDTFFLNCLPTICTLQITHGRDVSLSTEGSSYSSNRSYHASRAEVLSGAALNTFLCLLLSGIPTVYLGSRLEEDLGVISIDICETKGTLQSRQSRCLVVRSSHAFRHTNRYASYASGK